MNAWKVVFATLVIFGAGMVTGALYFGHGHSDLLTDSSAYAAVPTNSTSLTGAPHDGGHLIGPPGPLMPMLRKDYLKNLDRELQLTDTQREHIEKIISDGQDQTKALWDQIAPQIKAECQETRKAIQAELTPEQSARYDAILKKQQQRKAEEARHREAATSTVATNASPAVAVPTTNP